MSDSNVQKIFTYDEWIDLTGDEWDISGLVKIANRNGSQHEIYLFNNFPITEEKFKELSEMED